MEVKFNGVVKLGHLGGPMKESILTNGSQLVPNNGDFIDLRSSKTWVATTFNTEAQPLSLYRTDDSVVGKWIEPNTSKPWKF